MSLESPDPRDKGAAPARKKLGKKIHQQLISSCVVFPEKREDEYIYLDDVVRRFLANFFFWKKKRAMSTRDKLTSSLLK